MSFLIYFVLTYAFLSLGYLVYRYLFSAVYSITEFAVSRSKGKGSDHKVSIIIPCYNEDPYGLEKCIVASCDNSYPNKEIIVVDDGSKSEESWETIKRLQKKYKFRVIRFKKNQGKRKAMTVGFKKAKGEFFVTMDSDSIIVNGDCIRALIKPLLEDKNVGAVSGNIQVLNKDKNIITRIQWARYWLAFNIEKASQSPYSAVTCCSGPFSAYRKEYLIRYLDEWNNQIFLGQKCTYGDDRGLTTFMLKAGYKIKFEKDALCLTNVPESLRKFIKQQIRWKKSFIRENCYLLKFIRKKNALMQLEFFWFWIIFLMGFAAKLIAIGMLLTGNYSLISFAIMVVFVAMLHYIYAFVRKPGRMAYYGIIYGFLNEFLIMWLFWIALFRLKETKWGTR